MYQRRVVGCVCPTCGNHHFKKKRRKVDIVLEPAPASPPAPFVAPKEEPPLEDLGDLDL